MAKLPERTSPTVEAIYQWHKRCAGHGFREHLGASLIGEECHRKLWYVFRWCTESKFSGRMIRLFDRGQREEPQFAKELEAIGVKVYEVDPKTNKQFRVSAHGGHFGGSLDSIGLGIKEAPKTWHLLEFKTHNNKSFTKLKSKGVKETKPLHYSQMVIYMHLKGLERAFYLAVNKDTDDLYSERIKSDPAHAEVILRKAEMIIFAPTPPARINDDGSWWQCKFCDHNDLCHYSRPSTVTCRSCLHSTPLPNGTWRCEKENVMLFYDDQLRACPEHLYIPDLLPGLTQIDTGKDSNGNIYVQYEDVNGDMWINGEHTVDGEPCGITSKKLENLLKREL